MKAQEKSAEYLVSSQNSGWQRGTLGKLLPIKYGKSLPEKLRVTTGNHPVFGSSGQVGTHSAALTAGPTLIIGRKGNVGAIHYSSEACWPIDTVYYVEPPEGQNLRYYKYLLESLNLVKLDKSTAVPGLSRDDYNAVEVVVAPPGQQDNIVAEIEKQFSRLDEAVANLKRVKANLKRYKAAVLKAAVEGRLVETEADLTRREGRNYETGAQLLQRILETRRSQWKGKGKYKEPATPDTTDLSELPEGWVWANVDQLAEVGTGATPRRGQSRYYGGDIAWVTSAVVNNAFVDQVTEYVTKEALDETNLTLYPPGTLLVAMYGEGKTRGKCSELRISATTNQALAALQADASAKAYLKLFLDFNYEETRKVASGGVQPNLNLSLVRAVRVPFPPLLDQAHNKRNLAEYEGDLDVDDALVEALVRAARTVAERVEALGPVARD
ncbi:MAG: restriction endonuclease subunit S [Pseudomonadota bacterium]